jgi:hypothetical protein
MTVSVTVTLQDEKNRSITVVPCLASTACLAFSEARIAEDLAFGMGSGDKTVQETNRGRGAHSCGTLAVLRSEEKLRRAAGFRFLPNRCAPRSSHSPRNAGFLCVNTAPHRLLLKTYSASCIAATPSTGARGVFLDVSRRWWLADDVSMINIEFRRRLC